MRFPTTLSRIIAQFRGIQRGMDLLLRLPKVYLPRGKGGKRRTLTGRDRKDRVFIHNQYMHAVSFCMSPSVGMGASCCGNFELYMRAGGLCLDLPRKNTLNINEVCKSF